MAVCSLLDRPSDRRVEIDIAYYGFRVGPQRLAGYGLSVGSSALLGNVPYIFAAPENLAALAGAMKEFFDRTYYDVLERINGRPYATLICAGSDGENAARQVARIATGWRLRPVADPLIVCTHAQTPEAILAPKVIGAADLDRCHDAGMALAMGLAAGIF